MLPIRKIVLSVSLLAAYHVYAAEQSINVQAQDASKLFDYVDKKGCFVASGDQVRPVLPLIVAADGILVMKHQLILDAIDAALKRGCDINQPDLNGLTPLNTAIQQGNIPLLRYLINCGADPKLVIQHAEDDQWNGLNSQKLFVKLAKYYQKKIDALEFEEISALLK